jgi:hypothetical protein
MILLEGEASLSSSMGHDSRQHGEEHYFILKIEETDSKDTPKQLFS